MKTLEQTHKRQYNINNLGFADLFEFVKKHYNTNKDTLIYTSKNNDFFILHYENINFELQRTGTETQKQTYLNIKINEFVEKLKNKYNNQFNK